MSDIRTFKVSADDDGIRLDRWFKRHLPETTFNTVSRWARTGQLRIDGKRAAPGDRIEAGQNIRVPPAETTASPLAVQKKKRPALSEDEKSFIQSLVIHSDKSAFVINKPPGLATQGGTKTTDHVDRLLDGLVEDDASRPKLVHRLDKDTSGALLIARTPRAAAYFSKSFSGRTARKIYWALIVGVPSIEDGLVDLPLAKEPGTGGEKCMSIKKTAWPPVPAIGLSTALETAPAGLNYSLLQVVPTNCAPIWLQSAIQLSAMGNMARKTHF